LTVFDDVTDFDEHLQNIGGANTVTEFRKFNFDCVGHELIGFGLERNGLYVLGVKFNCRPDSAIDYAKYGFGLSGSKPRSVIALATSAGVN